MPGPLDEDRISAIRLTGSHTVGLSRHIKAQGPNDAVPFMSSDWLVVLTVDLMDESTDKGRIKISILTVDRLAQYAYLFQSNISV